MLNEVHQHFIQAVRDGRGDRLVESEGMFSGLIWSGEKALELGLVDAYGNTDSVARELNRSKISSISRQNPACWSASPIASAPVSGAVSGCKQLLGCRE